jgi:hypothetical protein
MTFKIFSPKKWQKLAFLTQNKRFEKNAIFVQKIDENRRKL